jgi:hypothetical protein
MKWTKDGIGKQEKLKRQKKGKDARNEHQPYIEVIDLIGCHN